MQARGQGFESLILHAGGSTPPRFFDMLEGDTRKKEKSNQARGDFSHEHRVDTRHWRNSDVVRIREVSKGARWMPRLPEARKDVTSCEKPGVAANER